MIRAAALALTVAVAPVAAVAHKLIVFASADCESVLVEAKFSNGRVAQQGEVQVSGGADEVLATLELTSDGTVRIPLDSLDHSQGLLIEVTAGDHPNYWILTPEDISAACDS